MSIADYYGDVGRSFSKKTIMFVMGIMGIFLVCSCNSKSEMEVKM